MRINRVILSDGDFTAFLEGVIRRTEEGLRLSKGDEGREQSVIETYIVECLTVSMSPVEIWDYFCISYPGIIDQASASESERQRLTDLFEGRMNAIVAGLH